jgi:hypothetical protein
VAARGQRSQRSINIDSVIAQNLLKGLDAAPEEIDVRLGSRLAAVFPFCVLTWLAAAEASGAGRAGTIALGR